MKKISLYVFFLQLSMLGFCQYPGQFEGKSKAKPGIQPGAFAFELTDVKVTGGIFKNSMDKDIQYLLAIEPNRLLNRFYLNSGLPVKGDVYGGWESSGLSGHSLGHYLSAISMAYASTGNAEFKKRLDYIVSEL